MQSSLLFPSICYQPTVLFIGRLLLDGQQPAELKRVTGGVRFTLHKAFHHQFLLLLFSPLSFESAPL